jgi:hypothetical protein
MISNQMEHCTILEISIHENGSYNLFIHFADDYFSKCKQVVYVARRRMLKETDSLSN